MIIRGLTADHDWQFGHGRQNYLRDNDACAENIETRLLSFLNDCFFNLQAGIDWLRLLGTKSTEEEITLSVRAIILQSYGVVQVNTITVAFDREQRNLFLSYNIDTIFTSQFSRNLPTIFPPPDPPEPPGGDELLTEGGDGIITEDGDSILTE